MLRSILLNTKNKTLVNFLLNQKNKFLTNSYACPDAWESRFNCSILNQVNLEEFYTSLDHNYTSKGIISAIDVDIFTNSLKSGTYLEEMRDILHKLRLSADTGNTLPSTHHATIRNYLDYGTTEDLINIIKDPLNYGIFMDDYTANILLDKLLISNEYEKAAVVASQILLQEDFSNEITCSLCLFSCYKYISLYTPVKEESEPKPTKVEEVKIRVSFVRNPYFDDHFDIKDVYLLSGKTLAWISESKHDTLNANLEIIGWLVYKKYDKLLKSCKALVDLPNVKVYKETMDLLQRESEQVNDEQIKDSITQCLLLLKKSTAANDSLEEALKINIENAINRTHNKDIEQLQQLLSSWGKIREEKLIEQTNRLDRAKRLQLIEEKQKEMQVKEQELWFFDNEDKIDLEIENKQELLIEQKTEKNKQNDDENYIPPEIIPKRK